MVMLQGNSQLSSTSVICSYRLLLFSSVVLIGTMVSTNAFPRSLGEKILKILNETENNGSFRACYQLTD